MSRNRLTCVCIVILSLLVGIGLYTYHQEVNKVENSSHFEHVDRLREGADPGLGFDEFPNGDYSVDESFTSHLPLVVIDLGNDEIPSSYYYDASEERFILKDNVDPYINANISIINNDDNINHLGDEPELESLMKIKYRGNSSILYDKHQYRFKLLDENGNPRKLNVLGMGEDSEWIINISMIDESLLRNYMCYSIAGEFMPYTPDVRFCEVVIKKDTGYEYQGLYLMMEPVQQGKNRVEINKYNPKNDFTSYIVRRDRFDEEGIMLDTFATQNQLCYGYLDLKYPSGDDVSDKVIDYVTDDISKIEKILFSEDEATFLEYPQYIDVDSFVDYFVFNEFFTNYDAGNNSTYLYKNDRGKLCIGPIWDYDNIADNISAYLLDPEVISFEGQTWFPQLLQSEEFCRKLEKRYSELRNSYFSDEYINSFVDDTIAYLGNARLRDWSRWNEQYTGGRFQLIKDRYKVTVDRNFNDYDDVSQRLKDILNEHGSYILPELHKLTVECRYKDAYRIHYEYAALFMIVFLSAVTIARRKV